MDYDLNFSLLEENPNILLYISEGIQKSIVLTRSPTKVSEAPRIYPAVLFPDRNIIAVTINHIEPRPKAKRFGAPRLGKAGVPVMCPIP